MEQGTTSGEKGKHRAAARSENSKVEARTVVRRSGLVSRAMRTRSCGMASGWHD
jgi:hypothetical protein